MRTDWEWPRKAYHSVQAGLIYALYLVYPDTKPIHFLPIIMPVFFAYIYIDHLRLRDRKLNKRFLQVAGRTMRPRERQDKLTSSTFYMVGVMLALAWWPRQQATLSLLFLAIVDTMAAFGGRLMTRLIGVYNVRVGVELTIKGIHPNRKTIGGAFAGGLAGACMYKLLQLTDGRETSYGQLLLAGCIASVSEVITIQGVDDDFSLPIMSGVLLGLVKGYLQLDLLD